MSLVTHRQWINERILEIFARMDRASKILSYLYLGSQWNASNFDELKNNHVGYILNVSCEIENFFPEHFHYLNIRVDDNDNADLLKQWEKTYQFIHQAKSIFIEFH
jgi:protein phosphatase slingshot